MTAHTDPDDCGVRTKERDARPAEKTKMDAISSSSRAAASTLLRGRRVPAPFSVMNRSLAMAAYVSSLPWPPTTLTTVRRYTMKAGSSPVVGSGPPRRRTLKVRVSPGFQLGSLNLKGKHWTTVDEEQGRQEQWSRQR